MRHPGRQRGRVDAREPEVENLQPAVARAHDVLGLEIAVHHSARMGARERRREIARGVRDLRRRLVAARRDFFAERVAVDELGGDVQLAVDLLERIDRADPRVRQPRGGSRLAPQPLALSRIADQMRRDGLQRDGAAEPLVACEIHASHAAATELADDRVRPRLRARRERIVEQEIRRGIRDGVREKRAGAGMMIEQGDDLVADYRIVGRFARDPRRDAGRIAIDRRFEQIADAALLISRHEPVAPLSSRNSHARARANRRLSVAGDMPSASALSSMLRPAK